MKGSPPTLGCVVILYLLHGIKARWTLGRMPGPGEFPRSGSKHADQPSHLAHQSRRPNRGNQRSFVNAYYGARQTIVISFWIVHFFYTDNEQWDLQETSASVATNDEKERLSVFSGSVLFYRSWKRYQPAGNINLRKRGYQWFVHMLRKTLTNAGWDVTPFQSTCRPHHTSLYIYDV